MIGPGQALFDRYPAHARPISTVEPIGNAGGLSGARLFRFRAGRGELVARGWPDDGRSVAELESIHAHLRRAGDLGFIPVPWATLDGRTVVELDGRAWEVAPWMPGTADLNRPPSAEHLRLGFGGLAAFLARVADRIEVGPSPGLLQRLESLERIRLSQFDMIRSRMAQNPGQASMLASRWLGRVARLGEEVHESTRAGAKLRLPLQPCLRDARPDHFLFDQDRLSGLVDFGAMGVDSVAGDLARLLGEAVGPDRLARGEAIAAFEAIRPLAVEEHRAITAFERANALLAPSVWIYWHFFEGRTFDEPDAVVRGLGRTLGRLDETFGS